MQSAEFSTISEVYPDGYERSECDQGDAFYLRMLPQTSRFSKAWFASEWWGDAPAMFCPVKAAFANSSARRDQRSRAMPCGHLLTNTLDSRETRAASGNSQIFHKTLHVLRLQTIMQQAKKPHAFSSVGRCSMETVTYSHQIHGVCHSYLRRCQLAVKFFGFGILDLVW